jgi:hypothetical protein
LPCEPGLAKAAGSAMPIALARSCLCCLCAPPRQLAPSPRAAPKQQGRAREKRQLQDTATRTTGPEAHSQHRTLVRSPMRFTPSSLSWASSSAARASLSMPSCSDSQRQRTGGGGSHGGSGETGRADAHHRISAWQATPHSVQAGPA